MPDVYWSARGAAPGWGPRPEYAKSASGTFNKGWLPYGHKKRMHGYRPWRSARFFEPLQQRLLGNRLCKPGDCWGPFRKGTK